MKQFFSVLFLFVFVSGFSFAQDAADINPYAPVNTFIPEGKNIPTPYESDFALLFDGGPMITHPGGGAGGNDASAVQTALLMSLYGFGNQITAGNSMADDFVVTGGGWIIDEIQFFGYQTNSGTTSTFNDLRVQIYNGPPNAGGTVIWGDLTTNRMTATSWTNIYRVLDTGLLDGARPIMRIVAQLTTPINLAAGTYWIEWQCGGTGASGPWAPPISILGQTATGNALQKTSTGWANALDTGSGSQQGMPFLIMGTEVGGSTARLQVIHNAADVLADPVDVYLNGSLLLNDFAFRAATPFIDAPAGVLLNIGVAPGNSGSANDTLKNFQVTLTADEKYVAFANGVLNPSIYASNPDGRSTAFTLFVKPQARETGLGSDVDFFVLHGSTDAPTVDIKAGTTTLVNDAAYGDITGYIQVPPANYVLDLYLADGVTLVGSFDAPLSGLGGGAAAVFASGFLDPTQNQNGEGFGIFAALPNGTVIEFLPVGGGDVFFENFEGFIAGQQVACQDPTNWTTWSQLPCSAEDATISTNYAYSGTKSFVIVPANDFVKPLGDKTAGKWWISFWVYMPATKGGYFNTLNTFPASATGDWGMEVYFDVGGGGRLLNGVTPNPTFTWTPATWQYVEVIVDLDLDQAQFWFNGSQVGTTWSWSRNNTLQKRIAANDFFGPLQTTADECYYDDYWFGNSPVPVELTSFTANVNNLGDVVLNWETATEINNQGFEIERRTESSEFRTIGFVEGNGTTTQPRSYIYTDRTAENGINYYRLKQVDFNGTYEYSDEVEVDVNGPLTFDLAQNYPNPFNPSTNIKYSVPESGNIRLSVFNIVGEEVAVLVNGFSQAGFFEVTFDASNLSTGVYLYKLQSANSVQTKKMMLLK